MFVHTVIMVIEPHMKQGRQHKLISTIFLATSVTKKLDHNNYYSEQRSINGYIRKLPKGSNASEQATNYAKQLGIELEQDETYVKPFIKHVLRVK